MYKLFFMFVAVFSLTLSLSAAEYMAGETITIRQMDTLNTDLFSGCRNLDINGVVKGDVFAGCELMTVEGEVSDDVIAGCRILTVTGSVGGNVIGFAQTIVIDGEVHGDILAFGGMVRITERAKIDGNVRVGSGDFKFEGGHIGGALHGSADTATLEGRVEGKSEIEAKHISFGPEYFAKYGTTLKLDRPIEDYQIEHLPKDLKVIVSEKNMVWGVVWFIWSLVALLIVGIVLIALFKNFSKDYLSFAKKQFGKNLGYGVLLLLLTPIAMIILSVLILTIPISLILLAAYLVLLYLSLAFSALYIGDYILSFFRKETANNGLFLSMFVGVVLVSLLRHVPIVGCLLDVIIICFGMGSLVSYIWYLKQK